MILAISDFLGRFHPVLVHLPIGILVLACFFQWLTVSSRFSVLQPAIPVMLFWGMLGAAASCISGYLLAQSGDYDAALTSRHQWMGIITAIISLILVLLHKLSVSYTIARWASLVLLVFITITGHLGGTLTHGEGYLTAALRGKASAGLQPIPNVQEAGLYMDVVKPILESKCYSCHGPSKQKGKLRLDDPQAILKGGEEGKAVVPGKPDESELIRRILLPLEDDDHMAPKEKPQLTTTEVEVLKWWVKEGADFSKKIKELPQDEKIKPVLLSLQSGESEAAEKKPADIPEEEVKAADTAVIRELTDMGVTVIPVAKNSNYLSVNFVAAMESTDSLVKKLEQLAPQIVWLKLEDISLSDQSWEILSKLTNITRLHLRNTNMNDTVIASLDPLQRLQFLNLSGTRVSAAGLLHLKEIKSLKNIFLYQAKIDSAGWQQLKTAFPDTELDTGGYRLPFRAEDTMRIKY
ncbi:MAG TPA: hypothetical protein PKC69_00320 [Chitinophagaceae bacterium]|nr:hypothetical protein [Chitinophagaceae bacterium]